MVKEDVDVLAADKSQEARDRDTGNQTENNLKAFMNVVIGIRREPMEKL